MNAGETSAALLRLLSVKGVGPAKIQSLIRLAGPVADGASALLDTAALQRVLSADQMHEWDASGRAVEARIQALAETGVELLSAFDPDYPVLLHARLGVRAPLLLARAGNAAVLDRVGIGFCGSRKASEKGLAVAADAAGQIAAREVNVVSGYAAGVDMAVHVAALEAGGTTTIVLAEGVEHFRIKRDIRAVWDWDRVCVVSEFLPGLPWSARNAMERNRTIVGLSQALVLIEAGETGGTIAAGRTALELGVPLFAAVYAEMPDSAAGNRKVLNEGAHPLGRSRASERANVRPVLETAHALALQGDGAGFRNQLSML